MNSLEYVELTLRILQFLTDVFESWIQQTTVVQIHLFHEGFTGENSSYSWTLFLCQLTLIQSKHSNTSSSSDLYNTHVCVLYYTVCVYETHMIFFTLLWESINRAESLSPSRSLSLLSLRFSSFSNNGFIPKTSVR